MTDRILTRDAAVEWRRAHARGGRRVVFTNGVFDILHPGHVRYLAEARRQGDVLIVAVNSDRSVRALKGPERPIHPEAERAEVIAALACVDAAVVFDDDTPWAIIDAIRPDVLVKGADWPADQIVGRDIVEASGGVVVRVKVEEGHSTTGIIGKVRAELAGGVPRTHGLRGCYCPRGRTQARAGAPSAPRSLSGRQIEIDRARPDRVQSQSFNHPDPGPEQREMRLAAVLLVSPHGQVVHANRAHAPRREPARGVGREMDEVLHELVRFPAARRIACPEEQALARADVMPLEMCRLNGAARLDLDNTGAADDRLERQGVNGGAASDEVRRRVHVGYPYGHPSRAPTRCLCHRGPGDAPGQPTRPDRRASAPCRS